jgi:hypothetical protein
MGARSGGDAQAGCWHDKVRRRGVATAPTRSKWGRGALQRSVGAAAWCEPEVHTRAGMWTSGLLEVQQSIFIFKAS